MDPYLTEGFGATKICDGLYIGDELASKDIDTIVINHITHIINCSAEHIANHFESYGIRYLSFHWNDTDKDIILDPHQHTLNNVASFIEDARSMGESCLIHTKEGYSTLFTVFAGYFMLRYESPQRRFQWTLYKVLQFLDSRVPKVQIKANCFKQLKLFEERLAHRHLLSNDWTAKSTNPDELIMRNTYINSLKSRPLQHQNLFNPIDKSKQKRLTWSQQQNYIAESTRKPEQKDKSIIELKSILKSCKIESSVRRDCSTGKRDEPKEHLDQSIFGSNYKLSVKKKLLNNNTSAASPLLPPKPEERKIIHLTANPIARTGSEKKIYQKEALPNNSKSSERSKNIEKVPITRNSSISKQTQQENNIEYNQLNKRILKSKNSERLGAGTEKSYEHPKFTTLFKNDQQPPKHKRELLNKSTQNLDQSVGLDDKKRRFFTEMSDFNRKQQLAKKLINRVTIEKTVGPTLDEKQNSKCGVKPRHFEGDQLFRSGNPNGFLALNLKILNNCKSQNEPRGQSNDDRSNLQTKKNNFINGCEESEKPVNASKPTRNESPSARPQQSIVNSNNLNKLRSSIKTKLNDKVASPLIHSNNPLVLKDASSIIGNIFSKDLYKPKWK